MHELPSARRNPGGRTARPYAGAMSLRHALLGVLAARPMSGYELSQFFDSSTGWVWTAPHSQIYPLLGKMEAEGAIESENQVRGTKLQRKVYSVTPSGLEELTAWIGTPHPSAGSRDPVLTQALLFDMVEPERAAEVLETFIAEQETIARDSREHSKRLLAKETPLLRERLKNRPAQDHDHIARLKAHVFEGQAMVADTRALWARAGLELLHGDSEEGK
jgi:DNA-binding PadR family transcriptional regulator